MDKQSAKKTVMAGKAALGIEFGSTRIKAVLVDEKNQPLVTGGHEWENQLVDKIWTYSLDEVISGLQAAFKDMADNAAKELDVQIETVSAIGISGMMHGYIALDKNDALLTPFRTWRNNITGQASEELTALFNYPIPQRWSVAHLYQSILNKEAHVSDINYLTTLSGYVHWQLTGQKVMGVGEASGMFPIDIKTKTFNERMLAQFDEKVSGDISSWKLKDILPTVLCAGESAGTLTEAGAKLIDPSGKLKAGIPFCPPEGDAGTGMVATNTIAERMGNVSAGTSVFACVVLEDDLSKAYAEIDQVTTPDGKLVAMAHANNCTSDLNAWVELFDQAVSALGFSCTKTQLFETLYRAALTGDADGGGLLSYGFISGEHMVHFEQGRPLFVRGENSNFSLANFMRVHLFSALAAMRIGLDILFKQENVKVDEIFGHGGLFKTEGVGQKILAGATNTPVSVMATAGEGGAWGMAVLASYMVNKADGETLDDYLQAQVFGGQQKTMMAPDPADVAGFDAYIERFKQGLSMEREAVMTLK